MTLAVILVSFFLTVPVAQSPTESASREAPQTAPASKPAPSGQKSPPRKPVHHKKKVIPSNCDAVTAMAADPNAPAAPAASTPANPTAVGSAQAGNTSHPVNCPPSKIIVRQGGASEPSIQLAGGPAGDQATQQRNAVNQMLAAADQNLKKMEGRKLAANQQDMVNQSRQFTQQARAALAAQDFDRARTLAWKAQLLSEELVKPAK
jgi:hypothetical protein